MKRYKLVKELPTFKIGETFYISAGGDLCAEDAQGFNSLVSYTKRTLDKFPVILNEWFEELNDDWTPWRAELGEEYWYMDDMGMMAPTSERHTLADDNRWEIGNYYRPTHEQWKQARRDFEKLKAYTTLKRDAKEFEPDWSDYGQKKWHIFVADGYPVFLIGSALWSRELDQIYFATKRDAKLSLETHRKEWELLFDLDEDTENEKRI